MAFFRPAVWFALAGVLSALQVIASEASAQQIPSAPVVPPRPTADSLNLPDATTVGPYLDRLIDRAEYTLGAGDVLTVSILGYSDRIFRVPVTPEGTVVIPTVGVTSVRALTLAEAERRIARDVRRFYADADVAVSLTSVRTFKVFLTGAVADPGVRVATAVTRVAELVPPRTEGGPIRRTALIRRSSGDTLRVDLVRFLRTGDLSGNPTLLEGDAIQIPWIGETVTVTGEVAFPGTYEFRAGETLAELLEMANGYEAFPPRAADTVWLRRFEHSADGEILRIPRAEAAGLQGRSITLAPFDAIFIPQQARFREQNTVVVRGEVVRPGVYPIEPNVTTVRELIEMAGGFTQHASLIDAVLRRPPLSHPRDGLRLLENVPPELLSDEDRRILEVTRRADDQNVVLDFATLFAEGGEAYDLAVMGGDELVVPERRDQVMVLGAVVQPGILSYWPGHSPREYVAFAGGFTQRAAIRDVVVLKARLGTRVYLDNETEVEPGDRIIVPFREARTFMDYLNTTHGVVNTISGIVLTVVGLERLWSVLSR
jgi:polysaccharide biosynthesis/export protein